MQNYFPKNLKFLRKQKKTTQAELADLLGKKHSIIGSYENGESEPSIEGLIEISVFFGKNLNDLILKDLQNYVQAEAEVLIAESNEIYGNNKQEIHYLKELLRAKDEVIESQKGQILSLNQYIKNLQA